MSIEERVRNLVDHEGIRELARRYAHCVWQRDAAGAADLFCEDAVMDTGDRAPLVGKAALLAAYETMFAVSEFRPFVHNHVFETKGNHASGTCYLDLRAVVDGKLMAGHGYYEDEYVRVGGRWLFRSRRLHMSEYAEVGSASPGEASLSQPD